MRRILATLLLAVSWTVADPPPVQAQVATIALKGGAAFASVSDPDGSFDDVGRRSG